jgi:hypothetical protein
MCAECHKGGIAGIGMEEGCRSLREETGFKVELLSKVEGGAK